MSFRFQTRDRLSFEGGGDVIYPELHPSDLDKINVKEGGVLIRPIERTPEKSFSKGGSLSIFEYRNVDSTKWP